MSDIAKKQGKSPFRASLDSQVGALTGRNLRSVLEIFAHLENLAARREKDSCFASGADSISAFQHVFPTSQHLHPAQPDGVLFRELGRQVIRTAKAQVSALRARVQEVQSLVLINDWKVAERLWQDLLVDCKTPLFELNFLEELWGIRPDHPEAGVWSLAPHWHQFILIQAEIEILLSRGQSLAELSDAFERHLGHWLKRFSDLLDKLDEESIG